MLVHPARDHPVYSALAGLCWPTATSTPRPSLVNERAKIENPLDGFLETVGCDPQGHWPHPRRTVSHLRERCIRKQAFRKPLLMPDILIASHSKFPAGMLSI